MKAIPLSVGTFFRNCSRASSPPADAPRPTTGNCGPLASRAATRVAEASSDSPSALSAWEA